MTTDFSWLSKTELLIGETALKKLANSHVMIVGLGGVGSFAAEFIVRSGVGEVTIIDGDIVDPTNRNRQLPALATNHGEFKAFIMEQRLKAINPEIKINVINEFIKPENVTKHLHNKIDYIIDAIDSVTPKITFMVAAYQREIPMISSMGAGGKMDPTSLMIKDISKTYNCVFAQQIRKMLKVNHQIKNGIECVFSPELPKKESLILTDGNNYKKSAYGTISYMPAMFGAVAASVVIRKLITVN